MAAEKNVYIEQIGGLVPAVIGLTPMSNFIILDGFRMAYLHRFVQVGQNRYEILDIFFDRERPGKIMAKLRKAEPATGGEPASAKGAAA